MIDFSSKITIMQTTQQLIQENLALKQKVRELEKQLKYDALTQVKSKAELLKLQDRREKATETLVIVFDLKGFGDFNKMYGHLEGDKFLVDFASKLKSIFRSSDNVYRFGGDEFVAVLEISKNYKGFDEIRKRLNMFKISAISYIGLAKGTKRIQNLLMDAFAEVEKQKLGLNK
jgi:diguanylate cyclase (GGDEF)-like protein